MNLSEIRGKYCNTKECRKLQEYIDDGGLRSIYIGGLVASAPALLFSTLYSEAQRRVALIVSDDAETAAYLYHDMVQILGDEGILYFPSAYRRAAKYGQRDDANTILRTEVLSRLSASEGEERPLFVVTSPEALAESVVSKGELDSNSLSIERYATIDRDALQMRLHDMGFSRVDYVYEPGQYAMRGSILDIYSFSSEMPYRIDFFGDDVDSIRQFSVETQLSQQEVESLIVVPGLHESDECRTSLLQFLPSDAIVIVRDLFWCIERIESIGREIDNSETLAARARSAEQIEHPQMVDVQEFIVGLKRFKMVEYAAKESQSADCRVSFDMSPQLLFHKNMELVANTFTDYIVKGYKIFLLTDNLAQADRLRAIFEERSENIGFTAVGKTLHEGFVDNITKCCYFTDHQIFDRFHRFALKSDKARNGKVALSLKEIGEFSIGDYVVHMDHGIGTFGGLVRIPKGNTMQEVIKLIYKNNAVVFVSIHSLYKISKYKGKEGEVAKINRLGSGAWENLKERTKGKIKDIARDLIQLYAKRQKEQGFAYSPDSYLQNELEASFIYEDTPDQLKATQDIKADMESAKPMDRLVCGDVGFGKTEVAIRAAFKAVTDSKQVAVLVPTTILAFQHYKTFSERLKDFPCTVEYLSRARSAAQVTDILSRLSEGKIDIIVGTHKLIGKGVKFKDLGLLIIDEEQKFGVSVKEKLKQLKVNVDTLTMTATPIPRTLQFSLMGARDLSVINTPPPNRYPIQTEVHTYGAEIIREAINFEMSRGGQLFLISDRISSLYDLQALVQREVPDARICVGHGQMNPDELEHLIVDFINHDYDVLIATSIIENGIDIPNVNTIIVNNAHHFGLSDLHQMRGRVGRSNKKAFCYLLAPPLSALPQDSRRRLQAIESFSELGSGVQIALQDLDIRGAGNMLGAEQSGFIADLGFETYQKILKEAVRELRNDEFSYLYKDQEESSAGGGGANIYVDDCNIETDLVMHLPADYVPNGSERILLYRELDSMEREEEIEGFRKRLQDRFGAIPTQAEDLIRLVILRKLGREMGIEKIYLKAGRVTLFFVSNPNSPYYSSKAFGNILNYATNHPMECRLRQEDNRRSMVITGVTTVEQAIALLKQLN